MIHIFITNSFAGHGNFTDELREELKKIPDLGEYYVFTSSGTGNEEVLVRKIQHYFPGEKLRFYACGGSGTFRNMFNAIEDTEHTEITVYPQGLTNDFLKVFGNQRELFGNLDALVHGKAVKLDYIETNYGRTVNSFAVGVDSSFIEALERYRVMNVFHRELPYSMALIISILFSKNYEYEIDIDGTHYEGYFSEAAFGNGNIYGGRYYISENCDVKDGRGEFLLLPGNKYTVFSAYKLGTLLKKDFSKRGNGDVEGSWQQLHIRRKDGKAFSAGFDGELVTGSEWDVRLVKQGMNFVIPEGMKL